MRTPEQHQNDVLASNILYGSLVISFIISLIGLFTVFLPSDVWPPLFAMLLLGHLLSALLFYVIRLGKQWAKFLLLLLVGITIVSIVLPLLSGDEEVLVKLRQDVWEAVNEAISFAAGVVALVLLFRKTPVQSEPFTQ